MIPGGLNLVYFPNLSITALVVGLIVLNPDAAKIMPIIAAMMATVVIGSV